MESVIRDYILEEQSRFGELYLDGHQFSQNFQKRFIKHIDNGFKGQTSCYFDYRVSQRELTLFHYAVPSKDIAKEVVGLLYFHHSTLPSLKELKSSFSKIMAAYPKRKHMVIGVHPHQRELEKLILRLKPQIKAYEIMGKPKDGLEHLEKIKPLENITIRPAQNKDLDQIIALEVKAHRNDVSSRIKTFNKNFKDELTLHHKNMIKSQSSFVATSGKKIIGVVGTLPHKPIAILATISINPKYQGKGISKHLYRETLKDLRSRRIPFYKGMTTTTNVMTQMKKMGRTLSTTFYEIEWSR